MSEPQKVNIPETIKQEWLIRNQIINNVFADMTHLKRDLDDLIEADNQLLVKIIRQLEEAETKSKLPSIAEG